MKRAFLNTIIVFAAFLCAAPAEAAWIPFSEPRRTAPAAHDQTRVVIASTGFDFLTGWTASTPLGAHVYTRLLRADGTVIGDSPILLGGNAEESWGLSVSRGRDGYFAAWLTGDGIHAATLDSFGRVVRRSRIPREIGDRSGYTLSAWDGATHFVLTVAKTTFEGAIFDNDANPLQVNIPIGTLQSSDPSDPPLTMTASSSGFLVVGAKVEGPGRNAIYGRRIAPSGTAGEWFLIRNVATQVRSISVARDGLRDVIVWTDTFGLWMLDVDSRTNETLPSRQLVENARGAAVAVAAGRRWITYWWNGTFLISVDSDGAIGEQIRIDAAGAIATNGGTVVTAGIVMTPEMVGFDNRANAAMQVVSPAVSPVRFLATTAAQQENARLASRDEQVLAVWQEHSSDSSMDVYFNRLDAAGPGVRLSDGGVNTNPVAAWNGSAWLVAWSRRENPTSSASALVARRVSASGEVLDHEPLMIADVGRNARVAVTSDGVSWLVVWEGSLPSRWCATFFAGTSGIFAARISPEGHLLDPNGVFVGPHVEGNGEDPAAEWNGSDYVLAWMTSCPSRRGVYPGFASVDTATVSRDLTRIDTDRLTWRSVTTAPVRPKPQLIAGADETLVAWTEDSGVTYRLLPNESRPEARTRRRRVAFGSEPHIEGKLVALSLDAAGRFTIIVQRPIPASEVEGRFEITLHASGTRSERLLHAISDDVVYTGNAVHTPRGRFLAVGKFDLRLASQRMWFRRLD